MRKGVPALFIILCLLFVSLLKDYKISVKASPTTWIVDDDGPADFNSIQEAINNASSGDTIFVQNGTYYENIIVNKTVSLIGENRETTIIDGSGTGNVISMRADNVSVESFTIRKSGMLPYSGILVDHYMGNDISNNKIIDNSQGITLSFSSNNVVCDNNISSNGDGITLYRSSNNLLSRNVILYNDNVGMSLYYLGSNVICDNNLSSNDEGIYIYSSSNNVISGNTIASNTYYGIHLDSSSNNVLSRNVILYNDLGAGISLYSSGYNVISGNTIASNTYYGIYFYDSSNNTIYHNNLDNTDQVFGVYTNFWNYSDEGNYWSDYTGQDLNGDGIGDNPHVIDEINQDNRPLMGIFSDFDVIMGIETYHVTIISNSTISDFKFEIGTETGNKIIHFNVNGEDGSVGFSRVTIPIGLMKDPYFVLIDGMEVVPTLLNISDKTNVCLYFTYLNNNYTINIISSETLHLYYELLAKYSKLEEDFYNLNKTYYELLNNYTKLQTDLANLNGTYYDLLAKYSELEGYFNSLNETYYSLLDKYLELQEYLYNLNDTYYSLLDENSELQRHLDDLNDTHYGLLTNYDKLQKDLYNLNDTYYGFLDEYVILLGNYSSLLESFVEMNVSYQKHLLEYSEQMQNFRSLIYIFAATTAIFIITTIYLSKHAHSSLTTKTKEPEDEK